MVSLSFYAELDDDGIMVWERTKRLGFCVFFFFVSVSACCEGVI